VGAGGSSFRNRIIFDIFCRMPGDGSHCFSPPNICIDAVSLTKRLVYIWSRRNQGRTSSNSSADRLPVKWITPTQVFVTGTALFFKAREKINRLFIKRPLSARLCQKRKSHCVVCIGNRKTESRCKEPSCRGDQCFRGNHWRNSERPQQPI